MVVDARNDLFGFCNAHHKMPNKLRYIREQKLNQTKQQINCMECMETKLAAYFIKLS